VRFVRFERTGPYLALGTIDLDGLPNLLEGTGNGRDLVRAQTAAVNGTFGLTRQGRHNTVATKNMLTVRNGRVLDGQIATERAHEGLGGGIVLVVDGMGHWQNGGRSHAGESVGGCTGTHISDDDTNGSEFFTIVKGLCIKTRGCKNSDGEKIEAVSFGIRNLGFVRVDETHSFTNVYVSFLRLGYVLLFPPHVPRTRRLSIGCSAILEREQRKTICTFLRICLRRMDPRTHDGLQLQACHLEIITVQWQTRPAAASPKAQGVETTGSGGWTCWEKYQQDPPLLDRPRWRLGWILVASFSFCATPPLLRKPHVFVCTFVPGVGGRATAVPYGESLKIISALL
jgi:hypothetical protein